MYIIEVDFFLKKTKFESRSDHSKSNYMNCTNINFFWKVAKILMINIVM